MTTVQVGKVRIGSDAPLAIIAGPCVAESRAMCLQVGRALRDRCAKLGLGYIFKASFDKANRSSGESYRGPGLDAGIDLIAAIARELGVPSTTDVHQPDQAALVARAIDLLQIPAFLCRQTDLLLACAATGKPVNVKKGQFLSPAEMANVVEKLRQGAALAPTSRDRKGAVLPDSKGARRRKANTPVPHGRAPSGTGKIILTERGTFFGYNRLVNDFVGLADMMDLGCPVCFDATHSTQQPGGRGAQSGGRPQRAAVLARCAVAAGVQAIFLETHPDPPRAKSDAASMLQLDAALALLDDLARLHSAVAKLGCK